MERTGQRRFRKLLDLHQRDSPQAHHENPARRVRRGESMTSKAMPWDSEKIRDSGRRTRDGEIIWELTVAGLSAAYVVPPCGFAVAHQRRKCSDWPIYCRNCRRL